MKRVYDVEPVTYSCADDPMAGFGVARYPGEWGKFILYADDGKDRDTLRLILTEGQLRILHARIDKALMGVGRAD